MNTADFINKFKEGKLGKKKQHASYQVMKGKWCDLLVRAVQNNRRPGDSQLIAIYFGQGVTLFTNNYKKLRDSVTRDVQGHTPKVTHTVLKPADEFLIESGIIEIDEDNGLMLVEIGMTPWLFHQDPHYEPDKWTHWTWNYNTATQISKRVQTIAEAVEDTKLPSNQMVRIDRLVERMPSDFVPEFTSPEDQKILMTPPIPFEYGFGFDDVVYQSVYANKGRGHKPLYLKTELYQNSHAGSFKAAVEAYNEAGLRFEQREPDHWEELTTNDRGRLMIGTDGQTYLIGHVYHRYNQNEAFDFTSWHKVLGKSPQIRLPI